MAVADWTGCPQCESEYVQVLRLPQGRVGFVCEGCGASAAYAVAALTR